MKNRMLIIKTGHAETFCEKESRGICSLGDVLRTSFILDTFAFYDITWFTDGKAAPLLKPLEGIQIKTLRDGETLMALDYELILNLEKDKPILDAVSNHQHVFGFVERDGVLGVCIYPTKKFIAYDDFPIEETDSFQVQLSKVLGREWKDEDYNYNFKGNSHNKYDIGLNWQVGPKWPEKAVEKKYWDELEKRLAPHFNVSWQQGFDDLAEYMNWIDSCETVISLDSLGLHLAIAMKKNTLALFGPTNAHEVELYERGAKIFYRTEEELNNLVDQICDHLL
jgi:heptosyltransferase-2